MESDTINTNALSFEYPAASYADPPILLPKLKSYVEVGSFVFFRRTSSSQYCTVGQIIKANEITDAKRTNVIINVYIAFIESSISKQVDRLHQAGSNKNPPEVIQSTEIVSVSSNLIENICFVFPPQRVHNEGIAFQGIRNCFVCRFRCNGTMFSTLKTVKTLTPFPCEHDPLYSCLTPSSYSKEIWKGLMMLQAAFHKMLNRVSEKQGVAACRESVKLPFSNKCFFHLTKALSTVVTSKDCIIRRTHYVTSTNLSRTKHSIPIKGVALLFESEEQLAGLQNVLGTTIMYGSREPKPLLNQSSRLKENSSLNIIGSAVMSSSNHDADSRKSNYQQKNHIIKMRYDGRELHITVAYYKFVYRTNGLDWKPLPDRNHMVPYPKHLQEMLSMVHTNCTNQQSAATKYSMKQNSHSFLEEEEGPIDCNSRHNQEEPEEMEEVEYYESQNAQEENENIISLPGTSTSTRNNRKLILIEPGAMFELNQRVYEVQDVSIARDGSQIITCTCISPLEREGTIESFSNVHTIQEAINNFGL